MVGGWWLVVGGGWLLVVGWWLVVVGWWLVVGGCWLVVVGWWLWENFKGKWWDKKGTPKRESILEIIKEGYYL